MAKKKKKKIYGPFSFIPYVPGMMAPVQAVPPMQGVRNQNREVPSLLDAASDVRGLQEFPDPRRTPYYTDPILNEWVIEQYEKSIFYPDDPADLRVGFGLAIGLNIIGGALWLYPPTKPLGTAIMAVPDYLVAIPLGVAASNLYQQADPVNQWNKAVGKPDHWSQWG